MTRFSKGLYVDQWLELPTGYLEGHWFESCGGLRRFLCHTLVAAFHLSLLSTEQEI